MPHHSVEWGWQEAHEAELGSIFALISHSDISFHWASSVDGYNLTQASHGMGFGDFLKDVIDSKRNWWCIYVDMNESYEMIDVLKLAK